MLVGERVFHLFFKLTSPTRETEIQTGKKSFHALKACTPHPKSFKSHFSWGFISIQWTLGWLTSNLGWFSTQMKLVSSFGFTPHERMLGGITLWQRKTIKLMLRISVWQFIVYLKNKRYSAAYITSLNLVTVDSRLSWGGQTGKGC